MFFSTVFSVVLALSSTTLGGPVQEKRTSFKSSVVEKLLAPPPGWVHDPSTQVDKDASSIKLRIHLVQQDMDNFHQMAMDVCAYNTHDIWNILIIVTDCNPRP